MHFYQNAGALLPGRFFCKNMRRSDNFTTQQSQRLTLKKKVHGLSEWPKSITSTLCCQCPYECLLPSLMLTTKFNDRQADKHDQKNSLKPFGSSELNRCTIIFF